MFTQSLASKKSFLQPPCGAIKLNELKMDETLQSHTVDRETEAQSLAFCLGIQSGFLYNKLCFFFSVILTSNKYENHQQMAALGFLWTTN